MISLQVFALWNNPASRLFEIVPGAWFSMLAKWAFISSCRFCLNPDMSHINLLCSWNSFIWSGNLSCIGVVIENGVSLSLKTLWWTLQVNWITSRESSTSVIPSSTHRTWLVLFFSTHGRSFVIYKRECWLQIWFSGFSEEKMTIGKTKQPWVFKCFKNLSWSEKRTKSGDV